MTHDNACTVQRGKEKLLKVPLKVENIDIHALVDTGAEPCYPCCRR